jgi:nitroreductase
MDTIKAITERFSYRGIYESTPVPREILKQIMEAGLAAPSGCNTQTTSLIGLDDAELIKSVTYHFKNPKFASAPAAVCVLTQHIPGYDDVYFNVQDYSAAIQNMLLAITALGYVSCWIEGEITWSKEFSRKLADVLGVPEGYELVAYLPVGKSVEKGSRVKKKPFEERAWFNGFGELTSVNRCLANDTLISLADGFTRQADKIRIGERLECFGRKAVTVMNVITGYEKTLIRLKFNNDTEIKVTPGHILLLGENTAVPAESLAVGNTVMLANGRVAQVIAVDENDNYNQVYSYILEGEGTYFIANGIYSGCFAIQNTNRPPITTQEQQRIIDEMKGLANKLR